MEKEDPDALPEMPRPGGRGHALEAAASMIWTLTVLAYASSTVRADIGTGSRSAWTILLVAAPVLLAGMHDALENKPGARVLLLKYLAFICMPAVLQFSKPLHPAPEMAKTVAALDFFTLAALWLPVDLRLLPKLGPTGKISLWPTFTATLTALNTFLVLCPFPDTSGRDLGYSFKMDPFHAIGALALAIAFAVLITPVVLSIGYGRFFRRRGLRLKSQLAVLTSLYFAALAEEILFRGVALNMLERALQDPDGSVPLLLSSILFGCANIKSKAQGLPRPNWRAAIIAALGGVPYGLVWRNSRLVTVSALCNAAVQYIFRTFFYKDNLD